MKNIGLIIALLAFVVLLFVVIGRRGQPEKEGVKELKVEKIDKDAVTKIDVVIPPPTTKPAGDGGPAASTEAPKHVVLEKDGTDWKVSDAAQPAKKFAADETSMKQVLESVGEFETGDLIANKKEKLAEYDIDDVKGTQVKLYTKTDGNKPALDLVFGRAAKGGGSTVRKAGSDDIYVAKGRLGTLLKKDVTGWRKKTIFDLKPEDVTQVSTTLADGSKMVVAASTTPPPPPAPDAGPVAAAPKVEWKLTEPAALPANFRLDPSQLGRQAASLASLRAQDFADGVSDAQAGFGDKHTVVEASTSAGKKIVIHVGKEDDKKRVYAKVDGDPQVYLLPSYTAKQLARSLDDLRDLTLFDAKPEDVVKAMFKGKDGTIVVEKKGDEWKLVEPKKAPDNFEPTQIPGQIASVLRTRGTRVAADAPKSAVDAKKASPVVEITLKSGKKQALRFGEAVPLDENDPAMKATAGSDKKPEPREFFVKGGVDDLVYVVPAFTKNRFDKPHELFKKPPERPAGLGGGGIPGMENLPPDVRKKLEESLKNGQLGGAHP